MIFVYKETTMTAIRHTATLTEWNGEHGIAQADSGEQYSVTRAQLYYAPYTVGSRIQIYVENGEVVDGGLIPIAGVAEDEQLIQQPMEQPIRGFNQSLMRLIVLMLCAGMLASLVHITVVWLFCSVKYNNTSKHANTHTNNHFKWRMSVRYMRLFYC